LYPSGNTAVSSPEANNRCASLTEAIVQPALRAVSPIKGRSNTKSAASSLRSRCAGWWSWTATEAISPSTGSTPAWFATTSAAPVSGKFSIPLTSTRNHDLKKNLSIGRTSASLKCGSNPNSSTL
jgi:hypothetical protein